MHDDDLRERKCHEEEANKDNYDAVDGSARQIDQKREMEKLDGGAKI